MTDPASKIALEACGATGPLVLGVEEPGASGVSWRVFDQPFLVAGRDPGSDLVLQDPAVSRRHAYFQLIGGRLFCVDLQSRTGTRWEGEPGLWGWVDPRAGVEVGPFRIRPRAGTAGSSTLDRPLASLGSTLPVPVPVSRAFDQDDLEAMTLELAGRTSGPTTWTANRALILMGSSPSCKIRLMGADVAAIHAAIVRTPQGVFAIDLLGPGGIAVNGRPERCVRLREGDEIAVAGHWVRVGRGPASGLSTSVAPAVEASRVAHRPSSGSRFAPSRFEDSSSLLGAVLEEFGRAQDRSADRLQATLVAVVESFVGLHQEQMSVIREELGRIRALTEEQVLLRARVEGRSNAVGQPPALRLVSGEARTATGRAVAPPPSRDRTAPGVPRLLIGLDDHASTLDPRPAARPEATQPRPTTILDDDTFHARVFDRLAEIQGERQGRWQKLMESLIGRGS